MNGRNKGCALLSFAFTNTECSRATDCKWHVQNSRVPDSHLTILRGDTSGGTQGDALLVTYTRDVAAVLQLRSLATGALVRELPMPGYGSVKEVCGRESQSQMYYSFESMTDAGSTYKCGPFCLSPHS